MQKPLISQKNVKKFLKSRRYQRKKIGFLLLQCVISKENEKNTEEINNLKGLKIKIFKR
jgi:hypothetical protein